MTNKKTTPETIAPEDVGVDREAEALANEVALKQQIERENEDSRKLATFNERGEASQPITAELVEQRIGDLMAPATRVFFEPCQRVLADNGKAYPLDWDFEGRDYGTDGDIVTRDRYEFLNKQVSRMQCSGMEMLLRNQDKAIETKRGDIVKEIQFGRTVGADVTAKVEAMAQFLGVMVEQRALIEIALKASIVAHAEAFGEIYPTAEQRARIAASRKASVKGDAALNEKLAALGVKVD